jgi:hypothetical protein
LVDLKEESGAFADIRGKGLASNGAEDKICFLYPLTGFKLESLLHKFGIQQLIIVPVPGDSQVQRYRLDRDPSQLLYIDTSIGTMSGDLLTNFRIIKRGKSFDGKSFNIPSRCLKCLLSPAMIL